MKKIKIKYKHGVEEIKKIAKGDWIDLRASETVTLQPMTHGKICLGVAMELPKGYEAHVLPRSSTYTKWGIILVNSMGIIDNSYCGDNDWWSFHAFNLTNATQTIRKGDRIAQFRIVRNQPLLQFIRYSVLGNKDRGGYGSTGVR